MKHLYLLGGFAALAFAVPASADESVTVYVACMTHYGDTDRPNDVTPVAKVTWPSPRATRMMINDAYFGVMQARGVRFYKAQCWTTETPEAAPRARDEWEGMSGYGKRPRRAQAFSDIFPAMFDRAYENMWRGMDGLRRSDFSAIEVGAAVDVVENDKVKRDIETERKNAEDRERRGPPQKLEIVAGESGRPRMTNAEADAKYAADMAEYRKTMAAHDEAVAQHKAALDAVEQQKAANAAATASAQAEFAKQQAEYREKYKEVTGRYPD